MIRLRGLGSFNNTTKWLNQLLKGEIYKDLDRYGQMGVNALASVTPKNSGETANSWGYRISRTGHSTTVIWTNSNSTSTGVPIVILLQYGHGTGTGGYVQGYDYINPAVRPIMDQIAINVWEKVIHA